MNDPEEMERAFNARATLRELKNVAEWFGNVRGRRKAILFVSEGIDYDIMDVFTNRSASTLIDDTRDTIAAATKANVSIYGIDPRGLTTMGDDAIEVQSFPDDTTLGIGQSSFRREIQLSQDSLRELSDETGGFAVVNMNEFSTAYDRIVKDNSAYYVLAYYPPNPKRDGRFHRIEVRVTRPGLTVTRSRRDSRSFRSRWVSRACSRPSFSRADCAGGSAGPDARGPTHQAARRLPARHGFRRAHAGRHRIVRPLRLRQINGDFTDRRLVVARCRARADR